MSKPTPTLATAALIAFGFSTLLVPLQGVTTFTSPSGYTTLHANKAPSGSVPSYSFISHSLAQKRKVGGVITAGGPTSLTSTGAGWTTNEFSTAPHFVLMSDGAKEGKIFQIVSNTADTLTLASGDLASNVNDSFRIYQHNTLASVFGADPQPNGFQGGGNASTADQVLFYTNGAFVTYFYKNTDIPDFLNPNDHLGWVSAADINTDAANTVLPPNKGFIVLRRNSTTDLDITVFGDVIDDSINVPIVEGYNLVCVPFPITGLVTLGNSALYDETDTGYTHSLEPGSNASVAELVVLWTGSTYEQFFYKDTDIPDFLNPNDHVGWVSSADINTDAAGTSLEGGFFILRKSPNPPLDWVFPSILTP